MLRAQKTDNDRQLLVGTWLQSGSVEAAEIVGACGFDFAIIDMEHSAFGWETVATLLRATQTFETRGIIRVLSGDSPEIFKALDLGADGILVPRVRSAEEVSRIVSAATLAPTGGRGGCPTTRASLHGLSTFAEAMRPGIDVWILVENGEAVDAIDEILDTGVTGVVLGPFDLSLDLGFNGDVVHPEVRKRLRAVVSACAGRGILCVASIGSTSGPELDAELSQWGDVPLTAVALPSDRAVLSGNYRVLLDVATAHSHSLTNPEGVRNEMDV